MKYEELVQLVENEFVEAKKIGRLGSAEGRKLAGGMTQDVYDQLTGLSKEMGGTGQLNKQEQLIKLAEMTGAYYDSDLKALGTVFNFGGNPTEIRTPNGLKTAIDKINAALKNWWKANVAGDQNMAAKKMTKAFKDWKSGEDAPFSDKNSPILPLVKSAEMAYHVTFAISEQRNNGLKAEEALAAYVNFKQPGLAKTSAGVQQAVDLEIGGQPVELKTAGGESPNYQLNSSAVEKNKEKAYLFITNVNTGDPKVFVVSADLIFQVITFALVEPGTSNFDKRLRSVIKKAVSDWMGNKDLAERIADTIMTGKGTDDESNTIPIGDSPLQCRLRLMFTLNKVIPRKGEGPGIGGRPGVREDQQHQEKHLTNPPASYTMLVEMVEDLMSKE